MIDYRPTWSDTTATHQTLDGRAATTSPIIQDHPVSTSFDTLPYGEALPDVLLIERAKALAITAQFLYHITVRYRTLPDGTYEVLPVGDNTFTTITSVAHLGQAIVDQITVFMESPAFIEQQLQRLETMIGRQA